MTCPFCAWLSVKLDKYTSGSFLLDSDLKDSRVHKVRLMAKRAFWTKVTLTKTRKTTRSKEKNKFFMNNRSRPQKHQCYRIKMTIKRNGHKKEGMFALKLILARAIWKLHWRFYELVEHTQRSDLSHKSIKNALKFAGNTPQQIFKYLFKISILLRRLNLFITSDFVTHVSFKRRS